MPIRQTLRVLAATLAVGVASAASAEAPAVPAQPMSMGDARLSCDALINEARQMETLLGGTPDTGLNGAELAAVGTSVAQHAALQAGAGRAFGAAGAIGGQVGGMFSRASKRKREEQAAQRAIAEKRWFYVVGLYQGRNCDNQPAN